jgi:UDP-2,3-diacylglucosamine pyrophosphatase LpxH
VHIKEDNYAMRKLFFGNLHKWVAENATKFQHIVVMGDVLDKHEKINTSHQNEAIDWFMELVECITGDVFVLVGNHDMINNHQVCNERGHWMYGIKGIHPRLHIVDKPVVMYNCVFCPYIPPGTFHRTVCEYIDTNALIDVHGYFAHQEFLNASMESFISVDGDRVEWLQDGQWIVSGHIHTSQWIKNTSGIPKVYYTGSSLQQSMGDTAPKTIALCTFPSHPPMVQPIDLRVSRRIKVHLQPAELDSWLTTADAYPENVYMLWIVCSKEEYKLVTKKNKCQLPNVKIRHILPELTCDVSGFDKLDGNPADHTVSKTWSFWDGLCSLVTKEELDLVRMIRSQQE